MGGADQLKAAIVSPATAARKGENDRAHVRVRPVKCLFFSSVLELNLFGQDFPADQLSGGFDLATLGIGEECRA